MARPKLRMVVTMIVNCVPPYTSEDLAAVFHGPSPWSFRKVTHKYGRAIIRKISDRVFDLTPWIGAPNAIQNGHFTMLSNKVNDKK